MHPAQRSTEGWQANYAAFIRYMIGCVVIAIGGTLQIRQLVPGINLPMINIVCVGIGVALWTKGTMVLLSS